ncbi:hypothetical protein Aperf_G00000131292 [Anoplocephala perfoliata]
MKLHPECVRQDPYIWKCVKSQGISELLSELSSSNQQNAKNAAAQAFSYWLDCKKAEGSCEIDLQNLIARSQLEDFSFDALLAIRTEAAKLGVPQFYLYQSANALKTRDPEASAQACSSTSKQTSVITKNKKQMAALQIHAEKAIVLRNLPGLQSAPDTHQTVPFRSGGCFVIFRNLLCLLGGLTADGNESVSTFDTFDLDKNTLSNGPPMQRARSAFSAVATADCIFVFGGRGENNLSACEIYKGNYNRWVSLPNKPGPRLFTSAVFVPSEGAVVMGGIYKEANEFKGSKAVQLLRIKSGEESSRNWSWHDLPLMLHGRASPGVAYFRGQIFVAGCLLAQHYDIECLKYPTGQNQTPQWTRVSIEEAPISHSANFQSPIQFPASFGELDDLLLLKDGTGRVWEYCDGSSSNARDRGVESGPLWNFVCQSENISNAIFFNLTST